MGLDVYLYRYEDQAATAALEKSYETETEPLWADGVSKSTRDKKLAAIQKRLGLDGDGGDPRKREIEIPSKHHPDHHFKIGYFRSSYNSGGIDRILREHLHTSLGDIMGYNDDDYCFLPDWKASRGRANAALADLRDMDKNTTHHAFEIDVFSIFGDSPTVSDAAEATKIAKKEMGELGSFGDWSSKQGLFMPRTKPQVVAFIPGMKELLGKKIPTVFAVTEAKPGEIYDWYVKALEIVVETCDYVLALPEPEHAKHWLHWSG